jgi:DNA-binding phage protein|uniref:Putative transcriptional regulator n=1 Tax=Marinomonas sp. (strain MWYL1) TaxID=400668 RepID=A6VT18_MARMS
MLKIIDVDWVKDHTLALTFSDGFEGEADLSDYFSKPPFANVKDFKRFALTADGALNWSGNELTASTLRSIVKGAYQAAAMRFDVEQMEEVIKQASWDSMKEGRPDILQAAIRSYVELFGHGVVIARAGIKSRTSAYRSLKPETKPNFATLVQLAHAVIEIAKERVGESLPNSVTVSH